MLLNRAFPLKGLLTTLPVLCLGLFGPLAPQLARRFGSERSIAGALLLLAGVLLYLEQKKAEDVELAFFKINALIGFVILLMVLISSMSEIMGNMRLTLP